MENNQDDTQPGILYDVSLENTLTNMKDKELVFSKKKKIKTDKDFGMEYPLKYQVIQELK